ncbi:MAG: hypothetical protein WCZ66_09800 [Sphingomonadaceae bacterium]
MRGTLFLVVGPSGAGKDTLLDAARQTLGAAGTHIFPRREISRPAGAGGELHNEVTRDVFLSRRDAGDYALCWEAHGLCYGISRAIDRALDQGLHVVCNVSRAVVAEARALYQPVRIILVTAPIATLARRIGDRGAKPPMKPRRDCAAPNRSHLRETMLSSSITTDRWRMPFADLPPLCGRNSGRPRIADANDRKA